MQCKMNERSVISVGLSDTFSNYIMGRDKIREQLAHTQFSRLPYSTLWYFTVCVCVNLCASQGELAIMDFLRVIRQRSSQGIASI